MDEFSNVFIACKEHASKPNPKLHMWPAANYIGCFVKIEFTEITPPYGSEHMWVEVYRVDVNNKLVGRLDNDPFFDVGVQCGDMITFEITKIEDLLR